jgi:uncharacterized phage infection (PIP) family protein YhgE
MKKLSVIACLLVSFFTYAQTPVQAPAATPVQPAPTETAKLTLDQRFALMKSRAQSYNDFKVVKELVLDGVWKITKDSITKIKTDLMAAHVKINQLENDVKVAKDNFNQKEASVADITFDSTHITMLGISFTKSAFIGIVTGIVVALVIGLLAVWGTLKYTSTNLKEKTAVVDMISNEFDEYKRKALDKESKILRQLQDERNKYHATPR